MPTADAFDEPHGDGWVRFNVVQQDCLGNELQDGGFLSYGSIGILVQRQMFFRESLTLPGPVQYQLFSLLGKYNQPHATGFHEEHVGCRRVFGEDHFVFRVLLAAYLLLRSFGENMKTKR
jgi:hypothetical protein